MKFLFAKLLITLIWIVPQSSLAFEEIRSELFPSLMPEEGLSEELLQITSQKNYQIREIILRQVTYFSKFKNVPYIWGGTQYLGSSKDCTQCTLCSLSNKVPVRDRFVKCKACQKCGIDCSHLANYIYERAGFSVPYASSGELIRYTSRRLRKLYRYTPLGTNLNLANTGDLLVYKGHVAVLLQNNGDGTGSIIHAKASKHLRRLGGIQIEHNIPLHLHLGIEKILRLNTLFQEDSRTNELKFSENTLKKKCKFC